MKRRRKLLREMMKTVLEESTDQDPLRNTDAIVIMNNLLPVEEMEVITKEIDLREIIETGVITRIEVTEIEKEVVIETDQKTRKEIRRRKTRIRRIKKTRKTRTERGKEIGRVTGRMLKERRMVIILVVLLTIMGLQITVVLRLVVLVLMVVEISQWPREIMLMKALKRARFKNDSLKYWKILLLQD